MSPKTSRRKSAEYREKIRAGMLKMWASGKRKKTQLTPALGTIIHEGLVAGLPIKTFCHNAGISVSWYQVHRKEVLQYIEQLGLAPITPKATSAARWKQLSLPLD
jgi:preprotein translocase subunit Sec61beta